MARRCTCSRRCQHVTRGSDALLPPPAIAALAPVIATLVDAAYGFDADGLEIREDCEVHGEYPTSNPECICRGERLSATEFVRYLELMVRTNGAGALWEPGHRPQTEQLELLAVPA